MHEHASRMRCADGIGRLYIFAHLVLQVFGAHEPAPFSWRISDNTLASGSTTPGSLLLSRAEVAAAAGAAAGRAGGTLGPMKVGGASLTPTSFDQSAAMSPRPDATISPKKNTTTTNATSPRRSRQKRRHASTHSPGDSARALAMLPNAASII